MSKLGFALLLITTTAVARPAPKPAPPKSAFAAEISFQSCTTSWAFACGMRDAQGRTFGTAHETKHCEKYTFQPDGTYSVVEDFGLSNTGTYKITGTTVRIMPINHDGTKGTPFELQLAADGKKLGGMNLLTK